MGALARHPFAVSVHTTRYNGGLFYERAGLDLAGKQGRNTMIRKKWRDGEVVLSIETEDEFGKALATGEAVELTQELADQLGMMEDDTITWGRGDSREGRSERLGTAQDRAWIPKARSQPTNIQGLTEVGAVGAECLARANVFTLDAAQRDRLGGRLAPQSTRKWRYRSGFFIAYTPAVFILFLNPWGLPAHSTYPRTGPGIPLAPASPVSATAHRCAPAAQFLLSPFFTSSSRLS